MKYSIAIPKDRAEHLEKYLRKNNVTVDVVDISGTFKEVNIIINTDYELIQVYHAGVDFGADTMGELIISKSKSFIP